MMCKIESFLLSKGSMLLKGLVKGMAPFIYKECRIIWYQPKEPDNIKAFLDIKGEKK